MCTQNPFATCTPVGASRRLPRCGRGGIGRRAALRSLWGNPWKLESSRPHQRNPLRRVFSFLANRLALTPQDAGLPLSQFGYCVLSCRQHYKNYGRQIIDPTPPELNGRTELASVTLSVPDTVGVPIHYLIHSPLVSTIWAMPRLASGQKDGCGQQSESKGGSHHLELLEMSSQPCRRPPACLRYLVGICRPF